MTKVLIVDDNANNVRLLTEILEDEGYEVFALDNGLPVIDTAEVLKPDIILLDIMMPHMDGFQVCQLLKSNPELKEIPVIMVTAKTEGADIKRALELGSFDYIKKPFDEIEVIARIQSALRYREQQNILKEMATRDSLTRLYNHSLLMELLEKELAKSARDNTGLAFIMLDIDHFKKVNDTYGHLVGDGVLKELASLLISSSRTGDIVGRYGGEEFGIVLPQIDLGGTRTLCERLREKIAVHQFPRDEDCINITISIGVSFKEPGQSLTGKDMVKIADEALYKAKHSGRNRVEISLAQILQI